MIQNLTSSTIFDTPEKKSNNTYKTRDKNQLEIDFSPTKFCAPFEFTSPQTGIQIGSEVQVGANVVPEIFWW